MYPIPGGGRMLTATAIIAAVYGFGTNEELLTTWYQPRYQEQQHHHKKKAKLYERTSEQTNVRTEVRSFTLLAFRLHRHIICVNIYRTIYLCAWYPYC